MLALTSLINKSNLANWPPNYHKTARMCHKIFCTSHSMNRYLKHTTNEYEGIRMSDNKARKHSNGRSLPCRLSCKRKFAFHSFSLYKRIELSLCFFTCILHQFVQSLITGTVYLRDPHACGAKSVTYCYYFAFTLLVLITDT